MGARGKRKYPWHRIWHFEDHADEAYRDLSAEARGILRDLECLAGKAWAKNQLEVAGVAPAKEKDVVAWMVKNVPRMTAARGRKVLRELSRARRVEIRRSGVVVLVGFMENQERAPTPEAERKRKSRAGGSENPDHHDSSAGGGSTPTLRRSPSISGTASPSMGCDLSQKGSVTSHTEGRIENEDERGYIRTSNFEQPVSAPSAPGGDLRRVGDLYDPQADPVAIALRLTSEGGKYATNTRAKQLREIGEKPFREALSHVNAAIINKTAKHPASLLTHVVGQIKNGTYNP